jgi:hypothetical protein
MLSNLGYMCIRYDFIQYIQFNLFTLTENWTKSSLTHAQELTKHTVQMIFFHSYQNSINLCI